MSEALTTVRCQNIIRKTVEHNALGCTVYNIVWPRAYDIRAVLTNRRKSERTILAITRLRLQFLSLRDCCQCGIIM